MSSKRTASSRRLMFCLALAPWLAGSGGLAGCGGGADAPTAPPPRPVVAFRVAEPSATIVRSFSGVTRSSESATLGFEIAGRIVEVLAVRGRRHEKGEVLARLDVSTHATELRRATAESNRANDELKRIQQLYESDNVSRAALDAAIAQQRTAAAALETAEKRVDDCVLRMPYSGSIGEVLRETQEIVSAGSPVVRLQGDGATEMEVGLPADVVARVSVGMIGRVRLGRGGGEPIDAVVTEVARESSADTTYAVTFRLETDRDLRDGLDGEVALELPNPRGSVLTVPATCVAAAPGGERYAWVLEPLGTIEGRARARRHVVEVGALREDGELEIVRGVDPGVLLAARGVHRLEEGQEVALSLAPGKGDSASAAR